MNFPTKAQRDSFYRSREWFEVRDRRLWKSNWACERTGCSCARRFGNVMHVHHIIPLRRRWDLRLDDSNLIVLCEAHHRVQHPKVFASSKAVARAMASKASPPRERRMPALQLKLL
jgi:5-methylcytosine-specific restriction endonuclease McrA